MFISKNIAYIAYIAYGNIVVIKDKTIKNKTKEWQNGWGWVGPLEIVWSNTIAQSRIN